MKLQYNRNRYYDYHTGRWLTHDPLGYIQPQTDEWLIQGQRADMLEQYLDGLNRYQYVKSDPVLLVDPQGTNIYLIEGNNKKGSCGSSNNALHQKVCVDLWRTKIIQGRKVLINEGMECYSFALTHVGFTAPKKRWLGFRSVVLCGCLRGRIYIDNYTGGSIKRIKYTKWKQDMNWRLRMTSKRVGKPDVYSVIRHNCRTYSQLEFDAAPGLTAGEVIGNQIGDKFGVH